MKLPQSNNYIVYRKDAIDKAKELYDIANKYGGFLHYNATEEDQRKIGKLLGYKESDIEDYIQRNYKIKSTNIQEQINRIQEMMNLNENTKKLRERQELLDFIIKNLKEQCEEQGGDSDEVISFDVCDFLETLENVTITGIESNENKIILKIEIEYSTIFEYWDEEEFVRELARKLKNHFPNYELEVKKSTNIKDRNW